MRCVTLVLLLVAVASTGAVARPEPAINVNGWARDIVGALKEWSSNHLEVDSAALDPTSFDEHRHHHHDFKFTLLIKYIVRPSIAKEFAKQWLKVRDEAKEAKGSLKFTLSKTLTDNLLYYSYQEWESKRDFIEWIKGNNTEVKTLAKYIEEKDIALTLTQLVPVAFHKEHHHDDDDDKPHSKLQLVSQPVRVLSDVLSDAADEFQNWMGPAAGNKLPSLGKRDPTDAIILGKYIVKPSETRDFVRAARLITRAVGREEGGSVAYGFSKTLTDDVTFYSYSVWENKEAVEKHLKSWYARKFLHYLLDHDVVLTTTILFPIESLDD